MNEKKLVGKILAQYKLNPFGTHGVSHWARVMETGIRLAEENGADIKVVKYFALFHDACRKNEGLDFNHGLRGANLARRLGRQWIDLNNHQFDLLLKACTDHTKGKTRADITIATCWDSDRLDLGRVNKIPDPLRLCTEEAKKTETIEWATKRAKQRFIPERVWDLWALSSLRFNEKGLPWLDRTMINLILERVCLGFFTKQKAKIHKDKQVQHFLQTLSAMQHYNYHYRAKAYMELNPLLSSVIPENPNNDINRMWLALALALKDLYRLKDSTLVRILSKSSHIEKDEVEDI